MQIWLHADRVSCYWETQTISSVVSDNFSQKRGPKAATLAPPLVCPQLSPSIKRKSLCNTNVRMPQQFYSLKAHVQDSDSSIRFNA